jgi:DNA-binding NtrC family response regulator
LLLHHFVRKHAARMGKSIEIIPTETMNPLRNWSWPGNICELENMIERMVILSKDSTSSVSCGIDTECFREPEGAAPRLGIKHTALQSMRKRFTITAQDCRNDPGTKAGNLSARVLSRGLNMVTT